MVHNPVVKKSFKHWARMIRFIRGYEGEWEDPDVHFAWYGTIQNKAMLDNIKETPDSEYCVLCQKYYDDDIFDCDSCPLYIMTDYECDEGDSIWRKIVLAPTKKAWLENAMEMIRLLFDLRFWEDK